MTERARVPRRLRSSAGFTIIELLIYIVLSLLVMGSVYNILISQTRQHSLHRETMDVRETLRGAGALLTSELRHLSSQGGDFYVISPQSVSFRSMLGSGTICTKDPTSTSFGLWRSSDSDAIGASAGDSVLIYKTSDGTWTSSRITQSWNNPSLAGVPWCDWSGGASIPTDAAIAVPAADTAGVGIGTPIRVFTSVDYGIFQQASRWWLGRKLGGAASYELVTGPLRSPSDSGLAFHFYDSTSAETAVMADVVRVEIVLRAESARQAPSSVGVGERLDSLRLLAYLRN